MEGDGSESEKDSVMGCGSESEEESVMGYGSQSEEESIEGDGSESEEDSVEGDSFESEDSEPQSPEPSLQMAHDGTADACDSGVHHSQVWLLLTSYLCVCQPGILVYAVLLIVCIIEL